MFFLVMSQFITIVGISDTPQDIPGIDQKKFMLPCSVGFNRWIQYLRVDLCSQSQSPMKRMVWIIVDVERTQWIIVIFYSECASCGLQYGFEVCDFYGNYNPRYALRIVWIIVPTVQEQGRLMRYILPKNMKKPKMAIW